MVLIGWGPFGGFYGGGGELPLASMPVYAPRSTTSTSRSAVRRRRLGGGYGGQLWTVLSHRTGGRGADRALDAARRPRAADGQQPLQRPATRRAAHVVVAAQQTPAGARAGRDHRAPAARGRARACLRADAGRRGPRPAGRLARHLEPRTPEARDHRRG